MSTVESYVTRQLDLRFIDARIIATEARISLGIQGYPTKDQVDDIRTEAIRIFEAKSIDEQRTLQQLNMDLESVKMPSGSTASSVDGSDFESVISEDVARSSNKRRGGLRNIFRR